MRIISNCRPGKYKHTFHEAYQYCIDAKIGHTLMPVEMLRHLSMMSDEKRYKMLGMGPYRVNAYKDPYDWQWKEYPSGNTLRFSNRNRKKFIWNFDTGKPVYFRNFPWFEPSKGGPGATVVYYPYDNKLKIMDYAQSERALCYEKRRAGKEMFISQVRHKK